MDKGKPVSVLFTDEEGEDSTLLYCELIQKARFGETFLIRNQGCKVGAYVLGETETSPQVYYYSSKRYKDRNAAKSAAANLQRLAKKGMSMKLPTASCGVSQGYSSVVALPFGCTQPQQAAGYSDKIKIFPYSGGNFDIMLLFLKPERAMRIIQAHAYKSGSPVEFKTGGIASICSDCTAYPMQGKLGISLGCKGSRKHSKYGDDEVVVGIPFQLAHEIDAALGKIPKTSA